ncbi:hypothetical protein QVD17_08670 [Tagetes erecta]|uniref:Uncharacterized protein n=1 Tax=Tagetes erecta TaxID=13708 RepID=A0AAD8KY72_TARER|nr:hypothetical protein QVD17_08670 [Tagetes erecta]
MKLKKNPKFSIIEGNEVKLLNCQGSCEWQICKIYCIAFLYTSEFGCRLSFAFNFDVHIGFFVQVNVKKQ